jgi:hypothetical protein
MSQGAHRVGVAGHAPGGSDSQRGHRTWHRAAFRTIAAHQPAPVRPGQLRRLAPLARPASPSPEGRAGGAGAIPGRRSAEGSAAPEDHGAPPRRSGRWPRRSGRLWRSLQPGRPIAGISIRTMPDHGLEVPAREPGADTLSSDPRSACVSARRAIVATWAVSRSTSEGACPVRRRRVLEICLSRHPAERDRSRYAVWVAAPRP